MSIDKLTDAECEITECVGRRLNVVIEAVEALRRMFEQHIAAEVGADPADDEADPVEGDTLDLDDIEARAHRLMVATWECDKHSHNDQWQMVRCDVPALVAAVRSLRAERDAAQARVRELEAALRDAINTIAAGAIVARGAFVRYTSCVSHGELEAWRAALGEEATDAE